MVSDTIYTFLGLLLVVSFGISLIALIAYFLDVPAERLWPIVRITIPLTIFCTLVGLWKKQVFASVAGWLLPL